MQQISEKLYNWASEVDDATVEQALKTSRLPIVAGHVALMPDAHLGIIPGSMGTRSYIVEGLGNPLSYNSCSHGAGRRMSRGAARRQFTGADLVEQGHRPGHGRPG